MTQNRGTCQAQGRDEVKPMPKIDRYELKVLTAFETGTLKAVATKTELAKFKAAARATAIKDCRVNIRLSSGDLSDIQVKALEQGVPYQTLIASVLHKYVTGHLAERVEDSAVRPRGRTAEAARWVGELMARDEQLFT